MATEDFTTYTEVDPGSKITVTSSKVSWATLGHNQEAYVYKDKGVDYFDGDFEHLLTVDFSDATNGGRIQHWVVANDLGGYVPLDDAGKSFLCVSSRKVASPSPLWRLRIIEVDSGTEYASTEIGFPQNTLYLKVVRDESVGTYGTLYCYVYTDAARTTLEDTLSLTLHTSKKDYRYIYACQTTNNTAVYGASEWHTGYTENLEIIALAVAPTVTTQAVTDIAVTTATGNGNITDLGTPEATQHGVCWNTGGTPTTADDKTEEGVPEATGAFTSSITGLTANTLYYVRAYATNSEGTSYGDEVSFTTLVETAEKGTLWQEGTKIHIIDANQAEQSHEGTFIATHVDPQPKPHLWFQDFETSFLLYIDEDNVDRRRLDGTATGITGQPEGTIWVEDDKLHGIDELGAEQYV